jgi:CarD family transcriptional regulator
MQLTIGNKVFYPYQGLCIIGPVVQKIMGGEAIHFYQLSVLDDGGDLFVPVDKIAAVGIRPLLEASEIPLLMSQFTVKRSTQTALHYSQRALLYAQLLTSGSPLDLVEIVSSLTQLSEVKSLSLGQRKTLDKAKKLLIDEISEVLGEAKEEIEKQIGQALLARNAA